MTIKVDIDSEFPVFIESEVVEELESELKVIKDPDQSQKWKSESQK